MKKTKRYDDGGYTGDDPIVKYRMGMIDAQGNDLTKPKSRDFDTTDSETPSIDLPAAKTPKSVERTVVKTKVEPARSSEFKSLTNKDEEGNTLPTNEKKSSKDNAYLNRSNAVVDSVKNTAKELTTLRNYNPLAKLYDVSKKIASGVSRFANETPEEQAKKFRSYSSGGKVKPKVSSASKRADGCAIRGKTRA